MRAITIQKQYSNPITVVVSSNNNFVSIFPHAMDIHSIDIIFANGGIVSTELGYELTTTFGFEAFVVANIQLFMITNGAIQPYQPYVDVNPNDSKIIKLEFVYPNYLHVNAASEMYAFVALCIECLSYYTVIINGYAT